MEDNGYRILRDGSDVRLKAYRPIPKNLSLPQRLEILSMRETILRESGADTPIYTTTKESQ